MQDGDTGVQSVQSFSSGTSTGTAGNIGLSIRKPIQTIPLPLVNVGVVLGYAETGMAVIPTDACLELVCLATTTSTGIINGSIQVGQG
mgnify:FL=1